MRGESEGEGEEGRKGEREGSREREKVVHGMKGEESSWWRHTLGCKRNHEHCGA